MRRDAAVGSGETGARVGGCVPVSRDYLMRLVYLCRLAGQR